MCGDKNKFMELDKEIRGNDTFVDHLKVAIKRKKVWFWLDRKIEVINLLVMFIVYQQWKTIYWAYDNCWRRGMRLRWKIVL